MTLKVLVVRIGTEPIVEQVESPFDFARTSLLKGFFVEALTLRDGVCVYFDEDLDRQLIFNRSIPTIVKGLSEGETFEYDHIRGNFLLTRHSEGRNIDLSQKDIEYYTEALSLASNEMKCKHCGDPLGYSGALFCGAACCARYEGRQRNLRNHHGT